MTGKPVIILRPEPGASVTAMRVRAAGLQPLPAPLFAAEPCAWAAPAAAAFDALLLTSANAARHAGARLSDYRSLPCWCVGKATAAEATAAGLTVARVGESDAASLLARPDSAGLRWLWLAGARHQPLVAPAGGTLTVVPVYAMAALPVAAALRPALASPATIMVHSAEAGRRLLEIVSDPALHDLVAISAAAAQAAGPGWRRIAVSDRPDDAEMVAIAAGLCQTDGHG
jgi:uroporphyrinogen-III synthase